MEQLSAGAGAIWGVALACVQLAAFAAAGLGLRAARRRVRAWVEQKLVRRDAEVYEER